jgi:hypothetical protein
MKITDFVIKGFCNVSDTGKIKPGCYVLENRLANFLNTPNWKQSDFHRHAGSLKSSQAFAHNLFSGTDAVFEYPLRTLKGSDNRPAQPDVMLRNGNEVNFYEVKFLEVLTRSEINFRAPYNTAENYHTKHAEQFVNFIKTVQKTMKCCYGSGIKQLCCHLLGIINETELSIGKLRDCKKVNLWSLCFDGRIDANFTKKLDQFKIATESFMGMVHSLLKEIGLANRIEYKGFIGAKKFLHEDKIGKQNLSYMLGRYYYNKD